MAALDLGCGSGAWTIKLAREYPHISVVGVDLVPIQPSCVEFEVDDINLGLDHFDGDFNVVHMWLISPGITNYVVLIDQISRILRAGGLLDVMEFDFYLYDHRHDGSHERLELSGRELAQSSLSRWLALVAAAVRRVGGDTDAASNLRPWIASHPGFDDLIYSDYWIPVAPHAIFHDFQKWIGAEMCVNMVSFLNSGRPLLLRSGFSQTVIDELQNDAEQELRCAKYPHNLRLQRVYCRKKRD
ncbi:S-adenosyl-L-methionine-dependent methyltransferase [Mycena olivaceomarginata]|nr:S-adenosyl-L-methionine-dependent methyltransferase [Mycena olivaceomarginata]